MKAKLRRNVILRDWFSGIDKYQAKYGYYPAHIEMNRDTLMLMVNYLRRHPQYRLQWDGITECARDGHGNVIVEWKREYICFEGVEIIIKNNVENEVMRIW